MQWDKNDLVDARRIASLAYTETYNATLVCNVLFCSSAPSNCVEWILVNSLLCLLRGIDKHVTESPGKQFS